MSAMFTMQDEAAIRQIVRDIEAAWNNRDGQAFARPFAPDADYRVIWGFKVQGRDAIAQGHQEIFDQQYRTSQLELTIDKIRFIRSDVAHVEVISMLHNVELPFERAIGSYVFSKDNDIWQVVTFNNAGILSGQSSA